MKKTIGFILALLLISSTSFAAVGFKNKGSHIGAATDIDAQGGVLATTDGSTVTLSGESYAATFPLASSATAITGPNVPYSVILKSVGAAAGEATTLQNGIKGQTLAINIVGLTGSGTWIVTPTTKTGFANLTFTAKGQSALLLYVDDTIGWIVESVSATAIVVQL